MRTIPFPTVCYLSIFVIFYLKGIIRKHIKNKNLLSLLFYHTFLFPNLRIILLFFLFII